ncbi:MAG: hypothetical protein RL595_2245 [Planctomycetota bacterium]
MAQVDLAYDSVGRLGSLTRTANGDPSTTISTNYALDLLDRVTSITHRKVAGEDVSILSGFGYSFDANGRVASYSGPEGSLSFALDANGQLVSVTGARAENYQYDPVGNRSATITAAGNLLLNDGQFAYTYDLEGNRKTRTRISDGQVTEFFWDYRNQLTKALVKDANGVLLKELRFTYDVVNRRVGVWVDGDGAGPADPDQVWTVYDGANPYMDFDGEGQLQARYLYGPGIDELFARIGTGEDPQWHLTDRLGSVRQIVDGAGTILDDISYDSFGGILNESNPAAGDRFKFTGREYCPELGIYYYRARWYDPAAGRFISQDPIRFRAGDPNLYRYVGNAPGDATDPEGLARITFGNAADGRVSVGYQGSWGLFYGSQELIGNLDPKSNLVERNGKLVSLNKLERIASSWWGFKPDWDEYFKENGYDPKSDPVGTYYLLNMALGLYPDTFINDFSTGLGQIADLYETTMWHYAGAGFSCGSGGSGKIPSKPVTTSGNATRTT